MRPFLRGSRRLRRADYDAPIATDRQLLTPRKHSCMRQVYQLRTRLGLCAARATYRRALLHFELHDVPAARRAPRLSLSA
jgi:hypothetical protein